MLSLDNQRQQDAGWYARRTLLSPERSLVASQRSSYALVPAACMITYWRWAKIGGHISMRNGRGDLRDGSRPMARLEDHPPNVRH